MVKAPRSRTCPSCYATAIFAVLTPFTTHVAQNGVPLLDPAVVTAHALLLLGAAILGLAMHASPAPVRVVLLAGVSAVVIELQFTLFDSILGFAGAFTALGLVFWLARQHAVRFAAVVLAVLWIQSAFLPAMPYYREQPTAATTSTSKRPPIIHIILDGHIGIEGIPLEFDPDRDVADQIRENLVGNGFYVYGRAYSRSYWTWDSLASVFNLAPAAQSGARLENGVQPFQHHLIENRVFERLGSEGYTIRVVQPFAIDLCRGPNVAECISYNPYNGYSGNLARFLAEEPPLYTRAKQILVSYLPALRKFMEVYDGIQRSGFSGTGLLPELADGPVGLGVTTTSTLHQLDRVKAMLREADYGEALFFHLLLPHSPYVLRADCSRRRGLSTWLVNAADKTAPLNNNEQTRAVRYPLYLEQVLCTQELLNGLLQALDESGIAQEAIVIVHGDHGSRIDTGTGSFDQQWRNLNSARDLVDGLSTLFAVRLPGMRGGYDRSLIPLDKLSEALYTERQTATRANTRWKATALLSAGEGRYREIPMARFSRGRVDSRPEGIIPGQ